jgi:hypothetical protein
MRCILEVTCCLLFVFASAAQSASADGEWHNRDCDNDHKILPIMCWVLGSTPQMGEDSRDPFLCRFAEAEADTAAPVLLAATRDDCADAGGSVTTPAAATEAVSE